MQYNKKVDEIIVSVLLQNERMSYLKLKGEVEKVIYPKQDDHYLSKSVYKFHIDQLLKDKVLHKEDDGKRGKEVYYSLTKAAKKKRQINILGIDSNQILFRNIYADLFSSEMTSSHSYMIDNLDNFLCEIGASKKELIPLDMANNLADVFREFSKYYYFSKEYEDPLISRIKSASSTRAEWEQRLAEIINVERIVQPVRGTRLIDLSENDSIKVYKPISGIRIGERKFKLFRGTPRKPKEVIEYIATVPGISIDDYMDDYMTKKSQISRSYKREHIEHAFDLLEKEGLIKRITVFRHKPRYVIADNTLVEFINDLYRFWLLELRLLETKWNYFEAPTEKEKERITLRSLQHILQSTDLVRNEFKKIERHKPTAEFLEVKKQLENYFKKLQHEVRGSIKDIKKRHGEILQKYDFLHDVIGIVCPAVLQK